MSQMSQLSQQPSVHDLFERLETVGKGAYGSVHKGIHRRTGNIVALKIINLDTTDDDVDAIQKEVALLAQLRDAPNVTKYFGCYLDGPRVWIVMEFAQGGSVRTLMQSTKDGVLEEKYIVLIVREVLTALSYLHKSAIMHRDIKAANILITATGKVMLCDFGVSALSATATSKRYTLMGTPNWMAPEVAQQVPVYDNKADIWSLGIVVYEMIKGAPPHADLRDPFKIMQLITRVQPPRLLEGEGSKDMRDFVAGCLRESPAERLSADELSKTRWIKSAAKANLSLLRDLILRYDAWTQAGGSRQSIAGPLDWEEDEQADRQGSSAFQRESVWEFDTLKRISAANNGDEVVLAPGLMSEELPSAAPTVRPPVSRLPTSLRGLFEDDSTPASFDTFRPPVIPMNSGPQTLTPPQSGSTSAQRERSPWSRMTDLADTHVPEDPQRAMYDNFAFPPRGLSRPVGKPEEAITQPMFDPLDDDASDTFDAHEGTDQHKFSALLQQSAKEDFDEDGMPPVMDSPLDPFLPASIIESRAETPDTLPSRGRSRTNTAQQASYSAIRKDSTTTVSEFQFPSPSTPSLASSGPSIAAAYSPRSQARSALGHSSAAGSNAHQTTSSFDDPTVSAPLPAPSRLPGLGIPLPAPAMRSLSANAAETPALTVEIPGKGPTLQRKPSLNRQASVAVMETTPTSPLLPPIRPFAMRERSGSSSSKNSDGSGSNKSNGSSYPGLKDAVKIPTLTTEHQLGLPDLLPPSPSSLTHTARTFFPSPSALSSSVTTPNANGTPLANVHHADGSSTSIPPRSRSPPLFDGRNHKVSLSQTSAAGDPGPPGPPVNPLDLCSLVESHEATRAHLSRTVDDLSKWLSLIETGFNKMLDKTAEDSIEEEQEESPGGLTPHDPFQTGVEDSADVPAL